MKCPEGMVLLAGADCDEHVEEAKKYILRYNLTREDVKLTRSPENGVRIITKREIELCSESK